MELAKKEEELKKMIAAIQREQIEERDKDLARIVQNFKAELIAYELTLEDAAKLLDLRPAQAEPARSSATDKASKKSASRITHREPNGPGTWRGAGRKPKWLVGELARGFSLESFEVSS